MLSSTFSRGLFFFGYSQDQGGIIHLQQRQYFSPKADQREIKKRYWPGGGRGTPRDGDSRIKCTGVFFVGVNINIKKRLEVHPHVQRRLLRYDLGY